MTKASNKVVNQGPHSDYPFVQSEATCVLAAALEKAKDDKGWSKRKIAEKLGYKSFDVLSNMALGRVPIPVSSTLDFARLLGMDKAKFLLAVLEQRHPDIDFLRVLGSTAKTKSTGKAGRGSFILEELEAIAGKPLDELPNDRVNLLRKVVADSNAEKRWLELHELPTVELLRDEFPQGLTPVDRQNLGKALSAL